MWLLQLADHSTRSGGAVASSRFHAITELFHAKENRMSAEPRHLHTRQNPCFPYPSFFPRAPSQPPAPAAIPSHLSNTNKNRKLQRACGSCYLHIQIKLSNLPYARFGRILITFVSSAAFSSAFLPSITSSASLTRKISAPRVASLLVKFT